MSDKGNDETCDPRRTATSSMDRKAHSHLTYEPRPDQMTGEERTAGKGNDVQKSMSISRKPTTRKGGRG